MILKRGGMLLHPALAERQTQCSLGARANKMGCPHLGRGKKASELEAASRSVVDLCTVKHKWVEWD
eukprot:1839220-Prymnesium_polylepis.1